MSIWTHDRVHRLTALWAEGHSASVVGAIIGVTRNAVIGKVHRLGLPERAPRSNGIAKFRRPRPKQLPTLRTRKPRATPQPKRKPNGFEPRPIKHAHDQCAGMTKAQLAADFAAIWANTVALQNGRAA